MAEASTSLPDVPHQEPPPTTNEILEYADLAIIDLKKYKTPEGRAELVREVHDAMRTVGFFYVINHGYTKEQTARMFDIADIPFSAVTSHEKEKYVGQMKTTGSYQGYKPRGYWHIEGGVRDQVETYNSKRDFSNISHHANRTFQVHRDVTRKEHPEALRPFLPDIAAFARHNHFNVLNPLLNLVSRSLELPEDTLGKLHQFEAEGETPYDEIVVNTGEVMDFLSGLYYKGTVHRVVQPPADQRHLTRSSIVYFGFANDDVKLVPLKESPVLQRVGITRRCEDDVAPTMEAWRKGRIAAYGQTTLIPGKEKGVQEEVLNGVVVKHYV
ncbi:hypothetical protein DXG03_001914 [Asterophora parasitica]|uniref:Non-haem dioxygenase N-terminal domain-containing protein n=1 Tax=Asterophora parasitica TaxID=117018 RepID=A0A9P7G917_9AGAR|nr:hypothetical protein DXG03_001914 [Asterophora parasitica]